MTELTHTQTYKTLLTDLKARIQAAQVKAVVAVNQELLQLYWQIGHEILKRQEEAGWGTKVIPFLSADLKKAFPGMKGFSTRNLKYMQQFASSYPDFTIGQAPLAQLSWYHNMTLLQKCKDSTERFWYAQKALEHGWSRNVMVHQIELNLYQREGKAITNFEKTLPKPQSDLAQQSLRDPYIFDFLTLTKDYKEKDLENELVKHITKFLLELGTGFAFVGQQYRIDVGDEDYAIDLLFYHLRLRCYIAIDLKIGKFQPAFVGQMNFYLSALDSRLKTDQDQPSIGVILCKDKNDVTVEYALRNFNAPIGIAEYKITEALPKDLKSSLPSIEDLENELKDIDQEE